MTWLYAVPFAAPLILISWLVLVPARNGRTSKRSTLQFLATGLGEGNPTVSISWR
ncbi:MAG: hypothetical protein ABI442_10250 [Gemmatimonadaceae bacterium]